VTILRLEDYDYHLPEALIAHAPAARRDTSSLMLVRGPAARTVVPFHALAQELSAGDLLVFNDTRVVPCRLERRRVTGGRVEVFVLGPLDGRWDAGPGRVDVHVLAKPSRKLRVGERLGDVELTGRREDGSWDAQIDVETTLADTIAASGSVPLPPYIVRRRRELGLPAAEPTDHVRYQTVYASEPGAVAAPTAGLHFTHEMLATLRASGVETAAVTLHVGIGTFKPLDHTTAQGDKLHEEWYSVRDGLGPKLAAARRVIAVGTTSARALEDQAARFGPRQARPGSYATRLFIKPGYTFGTVDALVTNFHLPRSSLLVLVSAFAGAETIRAAYRDAVETGLRFYSYGDSMLLHRSS
jgi:S-adenosylmethionine:tRNA ribosyltransferase-isomerase